MKPNILFILHLPPPVHGAAMVGSFVQDSRIIKEEFDANFINLATSKTLQESGKGRIKKFFTLLRIQLNIINTLAFNRYDLCYVTLTARGPAFYKDLMAIFVLKLFRTKIIYHFHNKGVASKSHQRINDYLYRYAFKNTFCILLSRHLYTDIERYVAENATFYCPNGVPPPSISCHKRKNNIPVRLLFLSNMMVEKGVYVLLEACKIIKDKGLNFECNFVGAWSDIPKAEFEDAISEKGLSHVIMAHGEKYNEDKEMFFCYSDVFILPTLNECFPLVLLEAMQFQLPVIATSEGGIPDVLEDNVTGFLIPPNNAPALAEKLERLLSNPELRISMGASGHKRFHQLFTKEKFERNLARILKEAINKK